MSHAIYIKIAHAGFPLGWYSPIRQTRVEPYQHSTRKEKNKIMSQAPEYSEDDEAKPKIKEPTHPLSPLIVQVNHPTRREDNPATQSLSSPQMADYFRSRGWRNVVQSPSY